MIVNSYEKSILTKPCNSQLYKSFGNLKIDANLYANLDTVLESHDKISITEICRKGFVLMFVPMAFFERNNSKQILFSDPQTQINLSILMKSIFQ